MIVLALRYDQTPVAAQEIAHDQGFSVKYLETLLGNLKRAGLIVATRGKTGGYALARHPSQITLFDARPLDRDVAADPRTLALSLGSVLFLQRLGAWSGTAAQAITEVHV